MATKKDYIIVARAINAHAWNNQGLDKEQKVLIGLVDTLCEEFKRENPRFNAEKFTEACFKK